MATNKTHKPRGRGELQSYRLALPAGTVLLSGLPAALADLAPTTPEEPAAISVEYPRMCRRLRDLGLTFQCAYSQRVAARIIGRSVRTLRELSRQGKITCCRCLANSPYYTVDSLDSYLSKRERGEA